MLDKEKEVFFMSKAAELIREVNEEKVNIGEVVQSLIDAKPSDDNNEQGKIVQLMRGLAFSDDPKSTEFMKRLTKMIDQDSFGDLTK